MTPEIEIGSWAHKTVYMSDIDVSEDDFSGFIDAQKEHVNAILADAWSRFVEAKKKRLSQERERYIDGIVAMCNTPFSTYWRQHFE